MDPFPRREEQNGDVNLSMDLSQPGTATPPSTPGAPSAPVLAARKKFTRVSHRKVKTGCITCRIRRVKCDETKPSCMRCLNFGRECDGYSSTSNSSSSISSAAARNRALLPQTRKPHSILLQTPTTVLFKDAQDYRYFRLFQEQTACQLTGFVELEIWNRLIPQACERDLSVRHAVVAIAALDLTARSLKQTLIPSRLGPGESEEAARHHRYALRQYSKAIKQMRISAAQKDQDLRTSLIASLLIICFETFHGNHESALSQIETGLNLIAAWRDLVPTTPEAEAGIISPNPMEVEDELIQSFTRLDAWATTFIDARPRKLYLPSREACPSLLSLIPDKFQDVNEAWLFASLMVRQLFLLCGHIHGDFGKGFFKDSSCLPPSDFSAIYLQLSEELEKFNRAFEPLWLEMKNAIYHKNFIAALSCRMCSLACGVIHVPLGVGGPVVRSLVIKEMHEEILNLSEQILTHPQIRNQSGLYCFETQVVAPVYSVVWKSPFPHVRKRAINILMSSPRREGFWDSITAAKVGQWLMSVEEEGFDGYVPIEMKITNVDVDFDLIKQTARVTCWKPRREEPHMADLRRTTLSW